MGAHLSIDQCDLFTKDLMKTDTQSSSEHKEQEIVLKK